MSTPEEREQMAAAIQLLNARLQQQETAVTMLTSERESLARQVQGMSSTPRQRVRAGVVDTRVIGKPDQFDGDPMKCADWSFKLGSYLGAVDQRYQQELTTTEASTPRLNETLESEGSALSTQMYYILVMTTVGAGVTMLEMEDMRVKEHLILEQREDHKLDTGARRSPRDHENTKVH